MNCLGVGISNDGSACLLCGGSGSLDGKRRSDEGVYENSNLGFNLTESEDEDEGRCFEFEVKGSGIGGGAWFGIIFFGGFIGLPLTFLLTIEARSGVSILLTWLAFLGTAFLVAFLLDLVRAQTYSFIVTEQAVHADGLRYRKDDILEIIIKNSAGNSAARVEVGGGIVAFGTGPTGVALVGAAILSNSARQIGASAGHAIQDSLAKRGNSVCIRHGRNVVPLAQHMDEDTEVSLFAKLTEVF